MAKKNLPTTSSRQLAIMYPLMFAVNALVVYFASKFFPSNVVLGTFYISQGWSLVHSMGTLALFNILAIPVIEYYQEKRGKKISDKEWMIKFFLLNFAGVWLLARFSNQLGFGITSWRVALSLALVLDFLQGFVMKLIYTK